MPMLDLHGDKLFDIETKVDRFIVNSQDRGFSQVRIMTGKGSGKIRSAVQAYLKLGGYPFKFEKMSNNQHNEGVLIVQI